MLVLVPAILTAFGQVDIVRSGLNTVAKPFEWCAGKFASAIDGFASVFTDYDELQAENEELRAQIESMENEKVENAVLKNLDQKMSTTDFGVGTL